MSAIKVDGRVANFNLGKLVRNFWVPSGVTIESKEVALVDLSVTTYGRGNAVKAADADDSLLAAGCNDSGAAISGPGWFPLVVEGLVTSIPYDVGGGAVPVAGRTVGTDSSINGVKLSVDPTPVLQPCGVCYAVDTSAVTADVLLKCQGGLGVLT